MNQNFDALLQAEEKNPELKAKAQEIEKKIQSYIHDYIALAAEYGVTLDVKDFYPEDGRPLLEEDLEKISGGIVKPVLV